MASLKKTWRDRRLSLPIKKNPNVQSTCSVHPPVRCRDMNPAHRRCLDPRELPHEMSTSDTQHPMAGSCPKHWSNKPDWLTASHEACCHMPQLYFRTHCKDGTHWSQLIRFYTVKSSCHSADYLTRRGSVVQVAPTSDGWTRFSTMTTVHPLTCGEMLSDEVILERCNGPRRLSDDDDDDDDVASLIHKL